MMELTNEQHLIRLAAEANAVLTPEQKAEMAESMDLTPADVAAMFEANEQRWEVLKDAIANPPQFEAKWDERISFEMAAAVINYGTVLGDCGHAKDCFWRVYETDTASGKLYYIGLNGGHDMWQVDERTARWYLEE